jgi:hypothetical protein
MGSNNDGCLLKTVFFCISHIGVKRDSSCGSIFHENRCHWTIGAVAY